jgi:hypothetical protein
MTVRTGAYAYIQWVREATFGTEATGIACGSAFGFEQKITGWSFTNNKIPLSQLNDVRVKTYAYGQTRGSLSLDFVLSSPWFLGLVGFKEPACPTTGVGPYTHSWDLSTCSGEVESFTAEIGIDQAPGADVVRTIVGGIVNSASISTSVGELAKITLDTNYKNETLGTALDGTPAALCVTEAIPFTFAHGTLEFPNCTVIAEIQDVNVTITQNSDHIWGIGDSRANSAIRRLTEITGNFKASHIDSTQLRKVYAQQNDTLANRDAGAETLAVEQLTLKLTFDNGEAGTDSRTIVFAMSGIALDDLSVSIEPNEPIFEDINFQARDCSVTAVNNTSSIPASS